MKKRVSIVVSALLSVAVLAWAVAGKREEQWDKVDKAIKKGLPKTAIEHLKPIIAAAIQDKDYPEAIKAIAQKIALEGNIQGNKPEERIKRMKTAIAKAPKEMVPVMDAILANWYWHFFQHNRWRFMRRTTVDAPSSDDILTWSLPRILSEIDEQFAKALSAEKLLKQTPVSEYDALLEKGNVPDSYRPTMYDFIAHDALAFYNAGEQAGAKSQDAFEIPADSPIFAPARKFMQWEVDTTDQDSTRLKAINLYQKLLRFHDNDNDKTAFADADLARLRFGYNQAFGDSKNTRYKEALTRFAKKWSEHQISARAQALKASVLQNEKQLVDAREVAAAGLKAYPDSIGGRKCFNIIQQIEAKSFSVQTERVWTKPWPTIDVTYRNLTKLHFRAVKYNYEDRVALRRYRPEQLDRDERQALLRKNPTKTWSVEVPATTDYQQQIKKLPVPKDLKPGFYYLIASHKPGFGEQDNQVVFHSFWVSELALVMRNRYGSGVLEGFVLDARSGDPIAGATIRSWQRNNRNQRVALPVTQTDRNGLFRLDRAVGRNYLVLAEHQGQKLATANSYYIYRSNSRPRPYRRTVFFTDRSLYRPGQTIQYQGLCIAVDQHRGSYEVLANEQVTVVLKDRNNREIASAKHRTNEYGSFRGSFNAPSGSLTGQMTIRSQNVPRGSTSFNVEEYKRPKFKVEVQKPEKAEKLNDTVVVTGKATAYTGAPIDRADVRYRVVREVRYPGWWRWRYWWRPIQTNSQEIANGFASTDVDGTFKIPFVAKPDPSVSPKDEPTFHYTIYADVTDQTGETRTGNTSIRLGYTALQASISADEWQTVDKQVQLKVNTTTLDGVGQSAQGVLKVYRLQEPEKVHRARLRNRYAYYRRQNEKPEPDLSKPVSWDVDKVVFEKGFTTDKEGKTALVTKLPVGAYRAKLQTQDRFGKKVTAEFPLEVINPQAKDLAIKVPNLFEAPKWTLEPGEKFTAVWGTGYKSGRAFVEIAQNGEIVKSYWTPAGRTQVQIEQAVNEDHRGGFTVRVTTVRENRAYFNSRQINVPWSNKELTIRWGRFVSKLEPGQKQTWTAIVSGPDAERAVAEMVATLYDESLDAYKPHHWMQRFNVFRNNYTRMNMNFENQLTQLQRLQGRWERQTKDVRWQYRHFPPRIIANLWGYGYFGGRAKGGGGVPGLAVPQRSMAPRTEQLRRNAAVAGEEKAADRAPGEPEADAIERQQGAGAGDQPNLDNVTARKNLNETAFFFPQLTTNDKGEVTMKFTMPEALTRWKFMGFAYDKKLRSGYLEDHVVTRLDLMVQPNPPRFVREGDLLEFTVKVTNQSDEVQEGTVRLTFADARTNGAVNAELGNTDTDKTFKVPAKQSRSFAWKIKVPRGMGFLTYKAVASAGRLVDGEEGYLPVLSQRVFVTESLPFYVRGGKTKTFRLDHLLKSGDSETLEHKQVVLQAVSQPSWYAVMALPYLMEYPYECSEQTFNRLYANAVAHHIATSHPKIRKVFDQWKGTKTLDSPLQKNKDLLAVALEETPWLQDAQKESQARRNVGILFDDNRLENETAALTQRLAQMQLPDGAWPWFPGGRGNDYITLYITTGYGRMRHLGVKVDTAAAVRALNRLDNWINRVYRRILEHDRKDKYNLSPTIALYLYGRSFFLQDRPIPGQSKEAVDYFIGQAQKFWLKLANRQSQAHLAVALQRFGDLKTPKAIMKSIKERSVSNEEMGMFWRDLEKSWWWYRAPIETQAMMIEAFDEVMGDTESVQECKIWLLRQKQTQNWRTTKATADAVYALLLRGPNPLTSDVLIDVMLGDMKIEPTKVEAGTGFFEERFQGTEVKPDMGKVTVSKSDKGISWGALHWQYLEDIDKVPAYEGTPLKLKKEFFTKVYTKDGPVLKPVVEGELKVGNELVTRVVLKVDRDMEYVHLKDARGSGTEPVNVLSRYRYQDGLAYYESTRDTATHFFIDYLPKGTYVFEYSCRVVHRGRYHSGMAQIQCMYAPEFNSHSNSFVLNVK